MKKIKITDNFQTAQSIFLNYNQVKTLSKESLFDKKNPWPFGSYDATQIHKHTSSRQVDKGLRREERVKSQELLHCIVNTLNLQHLLLALRVNIRRRWKHWRLLPHVLDLYGTSICMELFMITAATTRRHRPAARRARK